MRIHVCPEAELPPGSKVVVKVQNREILVVRDATGRVWGVGNRCPHQGAKLSSGYVTGQFDYAESTGVELNRIGEVIRCPWHNFSFDVTTGCSLLEPAKYRIATYVASIVEGQIQLDL